MRAPSIILRKMSDDDDDDDDARREYYGMYMFVYVATKSTNLDFEITQHKRQIKFHMK